MKMRQKQVLIIGILVFLLASATLVVFFAASSQETGSSTDLTEQFRIRSEEVDREERTSNGSTVDVSPNVIRLTHSIDSESCPHLFEETVQITGAEQGEWVVDKKSLPTWLVLNEFSGSMPGEISGMAFTCAIDPLEPGAVSARVEVQVKDSAGIAIESVFFDIYIELTE